MQCQRSFVMIFETLLRMGEYAGAGMYEEEGRSLFYRKALGLRRYYENCELYPYHNEQLYPSGWCGTAMAIRPDYLSGLSMDVKKIADRDPEIAARIQAEFFSYKHSLPKEHCVAGGMYTHSMPCYDRIAKEGLYSFADRVKAIEDRDIREGLLHLISGIEAYAARCVEYLESVSADGNLIAALRKVPMNPAETIYEAIVCRNFVLYLDNCDNLGCVAADLYPYYRGEDVTDALRNLFDNLDKNNGYSMSLSTEYNELTLQCLAAAKGKRRPMIELFVNEKTPDTIWTAAFDLMKTTGGQPAFYSERLLTELRKDLPVITDEDIKKFCGGGCAESMIEGKSCVGSLDAGINLLLILETCLYSYLEQAESFEDFYRQYIAETKKIVDKVMHEIRHSQKERSLLNPLPMRTLLTDDCIDNGRDFYNGGARYQWSIINFAGTINVIDSMLVIRDFVFEDKIMTARALCEALKADDEEFLKRAKKHRVSHGKDVSDANEFSKRITEDIFSMTEGEKPYFGEAFIPASIQFMSQVEAGAGIGATPDGRKAGAPLCDSLGAIFGKDTNGPTALLNSVASLDLKRLTGTPILNFNINESFHDEVLKSLILGYFERGGLQVQITRISKEELLKAYENPENYDHLIVRVGGYSERFNRLSDALKRMVIERTVYGGNE